MKNPSRRPNKKTSTRLWFFLVLMVVFLVLAFAVLAGPESQADVRQDLSFPAAETVYVTNSGGKYHRDGCSSLSRSKIAVSLSDALRSGYEACLLCGPPISDYDPWEIAGNPAEIYQVNIAGIKNSSSGDIGKMLEAEVVSHIDGDTVRVKIPNPPDGLSVVEIVRLLGVDTPETVHPNQSLQYYGEEASDFTRSRLLGRSVYLAFDWDLRDRYGRLLAYIYTGQGSCFNSVLIREGYGYAYLSYPFQFMDEFQALEREARRESRGLWAAPQQ